MSSQISQFFTPLSCEDPNFLIVCVTECCKSRVFADCIFIVRVNLYFQINRAVKIAQNRPSRSTRTGHWKKKVIPPHEKQSVLMYGQSGKGRQVRHNVAKIYLDLDLNVTTPKEAFTYDVRCFLCIFDLPIYPNQILYCISLFIKIRCSLQLVSKIEKNMLCKLYIISVTIIWPGPELI